MNAGALVQYQTGWGEFYEGRVVRYNEALDTVVVCDSEDGALWTGPGDKCEVLEGG